jgi:hypothetical protein
MAIRSSPISSSTRWGGVRRYPTGWKPSVVAVRSRRRRTRQLDLSKAEFGGEAQLAEITASCISEFKAKRLATVRKVGEGETAVARRLTAAAGTPPFGSASCWGSPGSQNPQQSGGCQVLRGCRWFFPQF